MDSAAPTTLSRLDAIVARYNERSGKKPVDVDGLLVSCLRAVFTGSPGGNELIIADLAQIEARVVCALAGQADALEEFRDYDALEGDAKKARDPYRMMIARTLKRDPVTITKDERDVGKVQVLQLGFGGGASGFSVYCASQGVDLAAVGITPKQGVDSFREARPLVVQSWKACEEAAVSVVKGEAAEAYAVFCRFFMVGQHLAVRLPCGRVIRYPFAKVEDRVPGFCARLGIPPFLKPTLVYHHSQYGPSPTYGGKVFQNIVQGAAASFIRDSKLRWEEAGIPVVLDVHDEIIADVPSGETTGLFPIAVGHMETPPAWAAPLNIPIKTEAIVSARYKK